MCYSVCAGESLSLLVFFSVWNKYNFMLHHMRSAKCRCSICISFYSPLGSVFFFHLAHSILHSYWVIVRHFVKIVPYDESQCRRWILIFERFPTTQRIYNVNTFHFFAIQLNIRQIRSLLFFSSSYFFSCQKSMHA